MVQRRLNHLHIRAINCQPGGTGATEVVDSDLLQAHPPADALPVILHGRHTPDPRLHAILRARGRGKDPVRESRQLLETGDQLPGQRDGVRPSGLRRRFMPEGAVEIDVLPLHEAGLISSCACQEQAQEIGFHARHLVGQRFEQPRELVGLDEPLTAVLREFLHAIRGIPPGVEFPLVGFDEHCMELYHRVVGGMDALRLRNRMKPFEDLHPRQVREPDRRQLADIRV